MSRRDFWICICVILTIFILGVAVGVSMKVLGVNASEIEAESEAEAEEYISGMPCENPEQFERWYETYEQKTAEESEPDEVPKTREETAESDVESVPSEVGTKVETKTEGRTIYTVNGELIDPIIQQKLYDALERYGIDYWYEAALAQMYQESGGNPTIVNSSNRIDTGLFQYREPFWDYSRGDIFDPEAQIELYVEETAARINAGLTVDEVISRHFTSDYVTEVDWEYVQQVKQWLPTLKKLD